MIKMEEWVTIRCLNNKGKSIRSIAKQLNISRNTVRKNLRNNVHPKYKIVNRGSQLDQFKEEIEKMHYVDKFNGARILEELRLKGYKGGKTTFYDYFSKINKKKDMNKISMPFETPPAKQCQFDWAHYRISINGRETKVYIFNVIMCYSRRVKYTASLSMDHSSVFEAIETAFNYFEGVPEEILMDNARQMVDDAYPKNFKWNDKFYSLCGFYGITPRACKIRTPKTKGKVEKPFQYLENHFVKGNCFNSFDALEKELEIFTERVNNKIHSTTKQAPNLRFEQEKHLLNKLPDDCFHGILQESRKVGLDLLISYKGNRYSVPYLYAGKYVWINRVKGCIIKIYSDYGKLIAVYNVPVDKGNTLINKEHYPEGQKSLKKPLPTLKNEFIASFTNAKEFIDGLFKTKTSSTGYRSLNKIISFKKYYSIEDIDNAISKCILWNRFSVDIISLILSNKAIISNKIDVSNYHQEDISNKLNDNDGLIRDLDYYDRI